MRRKLDGQALPADTTRTRSGLGVFAFMVDGTKNRYVLAFAETNENNS